jgi:CMP-N-acetylneuraminic acid synthetase
MAYVAFVPARSGSKRLPGKNIKMLADKPLVVHTLEAFVNAQKVDKVIFSTDSQEYWDIANRFINSDKLVLDYREPEQAGDKVKIFDYLKDSYQKIFTDPNDVFLMGLPTVPLRNSQHVDEAIALFEKKEQPVFSATEYGFPISFAFYDEEEQWTPVFDHSPMLTGNTRSQDQKIAYHPNGAIYVRKINDFQNSKLLTLYQNAVPYLMSRTHSVDIDNPIDFLVAEAILANGN